MERRLPEHFMANSDRSIHEIAQRLVELIRSWGPCAIAFSGGVDSAVVAKAAFLALGNRAIALTAVSPSLAKRERLNAERVASGIGISHRLIETNELSRAGYRQNAGNRCYFCKSELYLRMQAVEVEAKTAVILNGTNIDDLGDHRPGLVAASENRVRSPLVELGVNKAGVRSLAHFWDLDVANKPASPCLSSRIAYGEEVTVERLKQIERAEDLLLELGFDVVRVRYLAGNQARIEVPRERVAELSSRPDLGTIFERIRKIGFESVEVDQRGFESGRLNEALQGDPPHHSGEVQTYQIKVKSR